jgi:hypothetical protein
MRELPPASLSTHHFRKTPLHDQIVEQQARKLRATRCDADGDAHDSPGRSDRDVAAFHAATISWRVRYNIHASSATPSS